MDIVLVEPLIPQNTGSIARTCAATRTPLHLIEPIGFEISERTVRRAGLDYWPWVELHRHATWEAFIEQRRNASLWLFTKFGARPYWDAEFAPSDILVFGNETKGLGDEFLSRYPSDRRLVIPMECPEVRSLNLSNAVSIALYEAKRQVSRGSRG